PPRARRRRRPAGWRRVWAREEVRTRALQRRGGRPRPPRRGTRRLASRGRTRASAPPFAFSSPFVNPVAIEDRQIHLHILDLLRRDGEKIVGKRRRSNCHPSSALRAPSPRKRGEGQQLSMLVYVAPRPACGERVAEGRVRGVGQERHRQQHSAHYNAGFSRSLSFSVSSNGSIGLRRNAANADSSPAAAPGNAVSATIGTASSSLRSRRRLRSV